MDLLSSTSRVGHLNLLLVLLAELVIRGVCCVLLHRLSVLAQYAVDTVDIATNRLLLVLIRLLKILEKVVHQRVQVLLLLGLAS